MKSITSGVLVLLALTGTLAAEFPARYPSKEQRRKNFACENSFVNLHCRNPGERIRILLANYGRFTYVVCGQGAYNTNWNIQCSAPESMRIVTERCDHKQSCGIQASNSVFGDPCPDTPKYLQVEYYCYRVEDAQTNTPVTKVVNQTSSRPATPEMTMEAEPELTTATQIVTEATEPRPGEVHCKKVHHDGVHWPPTKAGAGRWHKCPKGQVGKMFWGCGEDGQWMGKPDSSSCLSEWLDNLSSLMDEKMPVTDMMSQLNSGMAGKPLQAGDLKKATRDLLPDLMKKMKAEMSDSHLTMKEKREKMKKFNQDMVKSGSELLDNKQHESWKSLDAEDRKKSATSLIVSLEQMALEVAATIEESETLSSVEQNLVMEVSVLKMSSSRPDDLPLPIMTYDPATYNPMTFDNNFMEFNEERRDFLLPLDGVVGISENDDITVTYLFYNNLEALMNPRDDTADQGATENSTRVINSNIVSASIRKHSMLAETATEKTALHRPMTFTLSHKENMADKVPVCAYWSFNESTLVGEWSTDGCWVLESTEEYTTCQCDHLTNFAVLMDVAGTKISKIHQMSLQAITYVGCSVSIICLIMCFISFSIFRNLQSDRNTIHKNLVLCLMIAELLFLFGIGQTDNKVGCAIIAGFLHFFFLASFSWMCLEGIQLYFMLIEVFEAERSRVRWFYAFGYGVPTIIVAISAAANHTGYGTPTHCWLSTENYFILSFVVPVALVVLINICMLSIAVYMMCRHAGVTASAIQARQKGTLEKMGNGKRSMVSDESSVSSSVDLPTWLKGSAVLVVLLGLTWTFGFMYVNDETLVIAYIFTILNSLQGLFIFIFHCFMDRKVKKEWRRAITRSKWLPMCCRVNIGGYSGNLSSPPSSSSQNYFMKFWSSRKRKRSTSISTNGRNRRSDCDSYLRSDTSSGCTQGTGLNRYSNQSEKLLPNGQNLYTAMPTHYEDAVNGSLSVVDCSVVDSEYVTEYCQHALQVTNEKREYSSGSESEDEGKDNVSHDALSKNRLSFLSIDSNMKLNSDFTSDAEEGKINYAMEGSLKKQSESERNLLNLLSMYQGKNGVSSPSERICTSQKKLDATDSMESEQTEKISFKSTKSAPNLKVPLVTKDYSTNQNSETTLPLLGSLPDLSTVHEDEDDDNEVCSKSINITCNVK